MLHRNANVIGGREMVGSGEGLHPFVTILSISIREMRIRRVTSILSRFKVSPHKSSDL